MAPLERRRAPIRVLVVDDEALARRNLTVLLRRDPDIGSVAECGSGLEAIEEIRKSKPDLVFLDVQMPECGGFDVLELLGGDLPPAIIFVTAYDEYALRAFEAGALDYLLKPFDDARFVRALNRAKDKLAHYSRRQPPTAERLVRQEPRPGAVPECRRHRLDRGCGLLRLPACRRRHAHPAPDPVRNSSRTWANEKFIRIHRSIIVNLERIRGLELQTGGEYEVVLKSKVRLRLSRRFASGCSCASAACRGS